MNPDPPLTGIRVLEFAGLGPAPFACMLLADLGADVITIRRPGEGDHIGGLSRGRPAIEVDLKSSSSVASIRDLVAHADVAVEGFRPGVMERLGLGPDQCLAANPQLIYARMTGWGQHGPRALTAGHDLTYLAVAGALQLASRRGQAPVPTANVLGDFGGGSMFLVSSVLAALVGRERTGEGRVLDVAIVDGVSYLASMQHGMRAQGLWSDDAGTNLLDTGAPFYDVYECADGRWLAVAPLEPAFFAETVRVLGLEPSWNERRSDPSTWDQLRIDIAGAVRQRTRDEWAAAASGTDACLAPVLDLGEAQADLAARHLLTHPDDVGTPGPMPVLPYGARPQVSAADEALARWGCSDDLVQRLAPN